MQTAAAHIVTADAAATGDPKIIIMTRADETGAAEEIERAPLLDANADIDAELDRGAMIYMSGDYPEWRTTSYPVRVGPEYWIVNVERI